MPNCQAGSDRLANDLQDVIEEVQQQAAAEGAFGRGTSRYTDLARPDLPLPAGAAWSTVKVKSVLHPCILNSVKSTHGVDLASCHLHCTAIMNDTLCNCAVWSISVVCSATICVSASAEGYTQST